MTQRPRRTPRHQPSSWRISSSNRRLLFCNLGLLAFMAQLLTAWHFLSLPPPLSSLLLHTPPPFPTATHTWLPSPPPNVNVTGGRMRLRSPAGMRNPVEASTTSEIVGRERERMDLREAGNIISVVTVTREVKVEEEADRLLWLTRKIKGAAKMWTAWRGAHSELPWPPSSELSASLTAANDLPPRNMEKFPDAFPGKGTDGRRQRMGGSQGRGGERGRRELMREREGGSTSDGANSSGLKGGSTGGGPDPGRVWGGLTPIPIVLLVHNRPAYLKETLEGLKNVEGIEDVLLIVSHDGFSPPLHAMVQAISFCRVLQLYHPFSPHLFQDRGTFPATASDDCIGNGEQEDATSTVGCIGQTDQNRQYRVAGKVSLKHHWWWVMHHVWHHLPSLSHYHGHVLFLEEDHYLLPNALRNLAALVRAKHSDCPTCLMVGLAPARATFWGDSSKRFVREAFGNIGYAFNRSVWERIKGDAEHFCLYDDYNWDVSLIASVISRWSPPCLPSSPVSLRWSRASAVHFGSCGFHIRLSLTPSTLISHSTTPNGRNNAPNKPNSALSNHSSNDRSALRHAEGNARVQSKHPDAAATSMLECTDLSILSQVQRSKGLFMDDVQHTAPVVDSPFKWEVKRGFTGWGGWGDGRDSALCLWMAGVGGPWMKQG